MPSRHAASAAAASSNDEDVVAPPKDGPPSCCAGALCGLTSGRSAEYPLAFTHHCLVCRGGLCGALCGEHYHGCKDKIDESKMGDILADFDDPNGDKFQQGPTDNSIVCKLCLDTLKIEGPGASKGGTNDEREQLDEPRGASDEVGDDDLEEPRPQGASEKAAAKKAQNARKTEDKKRAEERMIQWVQNLCIDTVVLTTDKSDVATLGGQRWNDVVVNGEKVSKGMSTKVKKAFMSKHNIQIREAFRPVALLGRNVAAHINEGPARRAIASGARKKSSSTAKPECITEDGTLFRLSNTVCAHEHGKRLFMELKVPFDKDDLTSPGQAKRIVHEGLLKIYNGDHGNGEEEDISLDVFQVDMSGYPLDRNIPRTFDKLTLDQFVLVLQWYQRQVKALMNAKRRSGSHGSAATAAGNVHWLIYAVKVFESLGDKDFMSCVDPQLDPEVMLSSARSSTARAPTTKRRRRNRRSRESTDSSDYDDDDFLSKISSSTKARKHSAMEAAQDAAIAITERNDELKRQKMTDR